MSTAKAGRGRAARKPTSVFANPGENLSFSLDGFARQSQSLGVSRETQTILSWSARIPLKETGETDNTYSLFPSQFGYSHDTKYQNLNGKYCQRTVSTQTVFDSVNSRYAQNRWNVETYRLGILSKFNSLPVITCGEDNEYSSDDSSDIENNNHLDQNNLNDSLQYMYDCLESPVGVGSQFKMSVESKNLQIEGEKSGKEVSRKEVTRIRLNRDPRRPVLDTKKTTSLINKHLLGVTKSPAEVLPDRPKTTSKNIEQNDDSDPNVLGQSRINEPRVKLKGMTENSAKSESVTHLTETSTNSSSVEQTSDQENAKELPTSSSGAANDQNVDKNIPSLFSELKFPPSQYAQNRQNMPSNVPVQPTSLQQNIPLPAQPSMTSELKPVNLATLQHLSALNYHAQQQKFHQMQQQMHQINLLQGVIPAAVTHQMFPRANNSGAPLGAYHNYHLQMATMPMPRVPSPDLSIPNTVPQPLLAHQNLHYRPTTNQMSQFPNQQWATSAPQSHAMFHPANAVNPQNLMFAQSIQNHYSSGSQM